MFETMVSFLAVEHLAGCSFRPPLGPTGYDRLLAPHRRPYETRDGHVCAMPYTGTHWRAFFTAVGRTEWAEDPALASDANRAAMIGVLYERLAACLLLETTSHWLNLLRRLDIPCAQVNSLDAMLEDEHLKAVGLFQTMRHPTEGEVVTARSPITFSGTPCTIGHLAPPLGRGGVGA